jgi:hypothetical protein
MKSTSYFNHIRQRPDRAFIKIEWIKQAIEKPIAENIESDGRIRRWTWVEEEEKFLRVILLNLEYSRTSSRKCEACSRSTSCRGLTDTGVLKYVWGRQTRQVVEVEHDPHLQQMARE